ncbi:sulfotransferase domain-containing protein [Rhodothermus profundi]|uniref:Sulfotransferase domain-containing protein n=1 Tax=Rhodothermus profundi TaxID=633813 RepID=A0A1M6PJU0_9BACT|nr:sulfotransferase domain-containing protein [Rhodothermus profundi]SHK08209.1 Sulfotransferase domain-containing protein [Rhodothermus profundi]
MLEYFLNHKNSIIRKGVAYTLQTIKIPFRFACTSSLYKVKPPIIVNSIPKSGTHLLLQIARSIPQTIYLGGFIAHAWSVTLRERSVWELLLRIRMLVPGEVVGAHIKYDTKIENLIRKMNCIHLFIYRDPRDIVISEAVYLTEMNRWHRLHKFMCKLDSYEDRIRSLIEGIPGIYGDISERLRGFIPWINSKDCICIRYEDLQGDNRKNVLKYIARRIVEKTSAYGTVDELVKRMESGINPQKSHTFREGGVQKWRSRLSPDNLLLLESLAHSEIRALGYELAIKEV